MKLKFEFNQAEFIIQVVDNNWKLGYICESDIEAIIYLIPSAKIKKEKDIPKSEVNQVTELQLRISIKNGKEILPSILVNWSFDDIKYNDLSTKIEQLVSEHIGYFLAYKDDNLELEVTSKEIKEEAPKSKSIKTN
ncbi:hypothetical protein C1646_774761 [Rhizophagus diaphanus]|nr:hypothetical protein C1646_774761 [Rhizophagus diaphanus] [Rhizophagus sp. MUCL 43196]